MIFKKFTEIVEASLLLFLIVTLSACGGRTREGCEPEVASQENDANAQVTDLLLTPTPQDPEEIRHKWENGPHADAYTIAEDNTNSSCARCHAPLNWAPVAENIPATWVENQLDPVEEHLLIAEIEWTHVTCTICHADEDEKTGGDIAWLEIPPLGIYTEPEISTQLCQKCHLDINHEGHQALNLEGPHRDFLCTDCHDAHDITATCSSSTCHEPFANECETIETHDKPHSDVTCNACHGGGEPEIRWNEELLAWDTFRSGSDIDPEVFEPYVSHEIVLTADCDRCHAPGDHPWDPQ